MTQQLTPGVSIDPTGKKTFIPLENNPAVFTALSHRLGINETLEFYDVYSLSDPDLLTHIPRPILALIFLAPPEVYHRVRAEDRGNESATNDFSTSKEGEPVIWFKQTIGHACGLIALLHSIANGPARDHIMPGSLVDQLLREATPLKDPLERASVLYNSLELEQAHMAFARQGDTAPPPSEDPAGYHFISFVRSTRDGHLWELEGGWHGPIDRGFLDEGEDLLGEKALALGLGNYLRASNDSLGFSLIALAAKDVVESGTR